MKRVEAVEGVIWYIRVGRMQSLSEMTAPVALNMKHRYFSTTFDTFLRLHGFVLETWWILSSFKLVVRTLSFTLHAKFVTDSTAEIGKIYKVDFVTRRCTSILCETRSVLFLHRYRSIEKYYSSADNPFVGWIVTRKLRETRVKLSLKSRANNIIWSNLTMWVKMRWSNKLD